MSTTSGTPLRSAKTPLRDVLNEMSSTQRQTPSMKSGSLSDKNVAESEHLPRLCGSLDECGITNTRTFSCSEEDTEALSENQENVTFKSFTCTGGEVELSDASVISDESVVVGALNLEHHSQTFSFPTVTCEDPEAAPSGMDKHADHPYCSHPSELPAVFMSQDMENRVREVCSSGHADTALTVQTEDREQADVTFRSFACPGGEIQIGDSSLTRDESLNAITDAPQDEFQRGEDESEMFHGHCELELSSTHHVDHPYCHYEAEPPCCVSGSVCSRSVELEAPRTCTGNVAVSVADTHSAGASSSEGPLVEGQGEVTLKPLCCSGVEVELESASRVSEVSLLMKNLTVAALLQSSSGCDEVGEQLGEGTAGLSPGSTHADHLYCRTGDGEACGDDHTRPSLPAGSQTPGTQCPQLSPAVSLDSPEPSAPGLADGAHGSLSSSGVESVMSAFQKELFPSVEESVQSACSSLLNGSANEAGSPKISQRQVDVDQLPSPEEDLVSKDLPFLSGALTCDSGQNLSALTVPLACESPGIPAGNFPVGFGNVEGQNAAVETSAPDSALGPSGNHSHSDVEVFRSDGTCDWSHVPTLLHTQLKLLSAVADPLTPRNRAPSRSVVRGGPGTDSESHLWPELLDSPIPPPQLNSTALPATPTPEPPPRTGPRWDKAPLDLSAMGKGPLPQQLRQMAELLILASGRIAAPPTPAREQRRNVGVGTTPPGRHSACVWTTPVLQADGCTNTSACVEVVKDADVSDACTSTDPLLWSMNPSTVASLSRSELEQKLLSTLIMVEVLSQQLVSTQASCSRVSTAPSDLRDKLVQTDHTQLSQTGPYKELYMSALERILALEHDQETLGSLHRALELMVDTMVSSRNTTTQTLSSLREVESIVHDDHEVLTKQVSEMKALYTRCIGTLWKMEQKTKVCLQERDNMRQSMEEAVHERHAVLQVLDHLRAHHTAQVSELQDSLQSQQNLTAALTHTHSQLVDLRRWSAEALGAACVLLREKLDDHTLLSEEVHKAHQLLQRTNAVLPVLNQRAREAVEESLQHQAERDRAVQDRLQLESQLEETQKSLRDANQHIMDLNTQLTIMTSEMGVLREQLAEVEEDRDQLQRKSTELSATVSSTLASYAFLEQALASESSKLQHSLHECREATEMAASLHTALLDCQQRLEQQSEALQQRDVLLTQLHTQVEAQHLQLHRLSQVEADLANARDMSEFLQTETELSREQLSESEKLLRSHLHSLRERNLECEDLREGLEQLRLEKASLQDELDSTCVKARTMLLEQGEQLSQVMLDVSLLHLRVCNITRTVTGAPTKSTDPPEVDDALQRPLVTPHQPGPSFLNSVMLALTEEQPCDGALPAGPVEAEQHGAGPLEEAEPCDVIGSSGSAFSCVPTAVPTYDTEERSRTTLVELMASLDESVSDLEAAVQQLKENQDSQLYNLQTDVCKLQVALQVESDRQKAEEAELRQTVDWLKAQAEKNAQILQQKMQDEKALRKLCSELEETVHTMQKHRAENNELRHQGVELRRALQQSQVEVQALREELKGSADQSSASTKELHDRIRLLKEVEKLKVNLTEVEESRSRLLERAKRHQMVHSMNQSKLERELHLLDDMIEAVRKALSSIPEVVGKCPELQKLVEYIG